MSAAGRTAGLRALLSHLRDVTGLDAGIALWDGTTVPSSLASDALTLVIADEGVIAALLRRPRFDTLIDLWVTKRFDLRNGTLIDLLGRLPKKRGRDMRRALDKSLALRALARFMFVPAGGPWPLRALHGAAAPSDGSETENAANVQYHYDMSNAFYALFLDPDMVYSCGYFTDWSNDLATAQRDKLDMTCRRLRLQPGDRFLDIGCGWGALVCHAAQHYGVKAHGVTLAKQQYELANEKVASRGLSDRVTVELRDYSKLDGEYDKIASVGMFEHVGLTNHQAYFDTIKRLLKPGGLYLHHAITRRAKLNDPRLRRRSAAYASLARYIFPGAEVDHVGMSAANLEHHGFEVRDVEGWREHYRETCRAWHQQLLANQDAAIREVGEIRTRLWIAYLAGCVYGFDNGTMQIFQTLAVKRVRGPVALPPTRADLYR